MRILSYNCCALPVFSKDIVERLERIADRIAELDPDIVALQEVFFPSHLAVLEARLPEHTLFTGLKSWRTFGGGLAVFSRFPIHEPSYVPFRTQGSLLRYTILARISRKGFITTEVRPPDRPPITLVVTHPVADYQALERPDREERPGPLGRLIGDPYPQLQAAQLAQLTEHLTELPTERPLVVAGDLNVPPEAQPLRDLLEAAQLEDCMEGNDAPSFHDGPYYRLPPAPAHRIDYVLHRPGEAHRLEPRGSRYVLDRPHRLTSGEERTLSDHFGVWVELHPQPH